MLAGSVNSAQLAGRCSVHCTYVTVLHHLSDFDCKNHVALDDDMHEVICALKDRLQSQDGTDACFENLLNVYIILPDRNLKL